MKVNKELLHQDLSKLGYNKNHKPCKNLENIECGDNVYLIWRPGTPKERKIGQVIRPGGDKVAYRHEPHCGVVVACGDKCKQAGIGDYIFWRSRGKDSEKPQPLIFDYTDDIPGIWYVSDEYVMLVVKEMGNE